MANEGWLWNLEAKFVGALDNLKMKQNLSAL